jgi:hypothetical protein
MGFIHAIVVNARAGWQGDNAFCQNPRQTGRRIGMDATHKPARI